MGDVLEQLLAEEGISSALDVHLDGPGPPLHRPPPKGPAEQRLTAFDVADEEAEERAQALRRLLAMVALSAGAALALAGSVALGLS
jgi:hypothetical protein